MAGDLDWISALLGNPLVVLGIVLVLGAALGDAAERARIPWITGCILVGVALGPAATGVLQKPELRALDGFLQASLAVIAFNIGSQLVLARLEAIGRSIVLLALAQLVAPFVLVAIAESMAGMALTTALLVAAVAPATAPTTTYAVIKRLNASGPFVDRVLGVLAINDSAAILIFSVTSAAVLAMMTSPGTLASITPAFLDTLMNEAVSVGAGIALGIFYLAVRPLVADGRPGWEARMTAMLLGLIVIAIGGAIALGLSHLLVPLTLGIVVANGVDSAERQHIQQMIRGFEEPLFIVFFVLAGAHLPVSAAEHIGIVAAALIYICGRFVGKYGGIFVTASALRLEPPTRHYLGLCFPSQGGLAMGLVLAFRTLPEVRALPPDSAHMIDTAVSLVLFAVLVSQLIGPLLIDVAVRRAGACKIAAPRDARGDPDRTGA